MHLIMDFKNEQQIIEFMAWLQHNGEEDYNLYRTLDPFTALHTGLDEVNMAFDYENHLIIVKNK